MKKAVLTLLALFPLCVHAQIEESIAALESFKSQYNLKGSQSLQLEKVIYSLRQDLKQYNQMDAMVESLAEAQSEQESLRRKLEQENAMLLQENEYLKFLLDESPAGSGGIIDGKFYPVGIERAMAAVPSVEIRELQAYFSKIREFLVAMGFQILDSARDPRGAQQVRASKKIDATTMYDLIIWVERDFNNPDSRYDVHILFGDNTKIDNEFKRRYLLSDQGKKTYQAILQKIENINN